MAQYIRRAGAAALLTAALLTTACGDDAARGDSALAGDSSLTRDLQLAGADTGVQPQLQDVPTGGTAEPPPLTSQPAANPPGTRTPARTPSRTPTPSRPATTTPSRPSTTPSGNTASSGGTGGGTVGSVAAGTTLALTSDARVCTNTYQVGSTFTATVSEAVTGTNGVRIPAGAKVSLTVTRAKRSENVRDPIVFEFAVNSVTFGGTRYPLEATVASAAVDRVENQPASKDAQKVAVGAAAGAIAGRVLGGNTKGAVIGGAIGAAAGAATAKATANYEGCVPDGGAIRITLNEPVQIRA